MLQWRTASPATWPRGWTVPSGARWKIGTALLVTAEIVILFVGIVARYAFHHPLIWSDELASLLFLWLAMLGTVLALRRGEHMRMTALVNTGSHRVRHFFDLLALAAALAFLGAILLPAFDYAANESIVSIMSLDISMAWRAAAMPVGVALLGLTILLRILAQPRPATLLALALVAAIVLALVLLHPVLLTLGRGNLIVFFLGVVSLTVFAGIPIAFSFGLATLGYLAFATHVPITVLVARMDSGMSHPVLLSVPLFVFLGLLIEMTGMAQVMVRFLANLLGHVRGGLSFVLIGAMYLVSGISGSKAADMAAVAPVLFPEMEQRGARRGDLVALLAATGAQTETIPPSLILITIGSVTSISIAALFTGGLLPGLVVGLILCVLVGWRARREDRAIPPRAGMAEIGRSFLIAIPALALPFLIRGAVVGGRRHRDRGLHHRHRLFGAGGAADLPPVRSVPVAADAGADRLAHRGDPADRRRRHRHGLGDHVVGLFPGRRRLDRGDAGRGGIVHGDLDRAVRRARQRAGGHSRHRAVRPAAVPDRAPGRHPRGALRDGGDPGDGRGAVRAAVRRRLLRRLRDRPLQSR